MPCPFSVTLGGGKKTVMVLIWVLAASRGGGGGAGGDSCFQNYLVCLSVRSYCLSV